MSNNVEAVILVRVFSTLHLTTLSLKGYGFNKALKYPSLHNILISNKIESLLVQSKVG